MFDSSPFEDTEPRCPAYRWEPGFGPCLCRGRVHEAEVLLDSGRVPAMPDCAHDGEGVCTTGEYGALQRFCCDCGAVYDG